VFLVRCPPPPHPCTYIMSPLHQVVNTEGIAMLLVRCRAFAIILSFIENEARSHCALSFAMETAALSYGMTSPCRRRERERGIGLTLLLYPRPGLWHDVTMPKERERERERRGQHARDVTAWSARNRTILLRDTLFWCACRHRKSRSGERGGVLVACFRFYQC
jgi:hypothetical protein